MTPLDLHDAAAALLEDAHAFHRAAEQEDSHFGAPAALERLQEALEVLSGAWYRVASRTYGEGLSREQEVLLMGAVHDVAAAFARCARACRAGESTVAPAIARRVQAEQAGAAGRNEEPWFAGWSRAGEVRR
jgi:hypothetical protein